MIQTIDAVYDGTTLRPDGPLPLAPETRVRLTMEVLPAEDAAGPEAAGDEPLPPGAYSFFRYALANPIEGGPPDWSGNVDRYLYGDELHPPR